MNSTIPCAPASVFRVLGVDTSLRCTGLGVVEARGNSYQALWYGCVRNAQSLRLSECLSRLQHDMRICLNEWQPVAVAVEGVFFARNVKTAVLLGHARGAILAEAAAHALPIFEYPPRRVKQAITGSGAAQKSQVSRMVMRLLNLTEQPQEDAADALAIALTHLQNRTSLTALKPTNI